MSTGGVLHQVFAPIELLSVLHSKRNAHTHAHICTQSKPAIYVYSELVPGSFRVLPIYLLPCLLVFHSAQIQTCSKEHKCA